MSALFLASECILEKMEKMKKTIFILGFLSSFWIVQNSYGQIELPPPSETPHTDMAEPSAYHHTVFLDEYNIPEQAKVIQLPKPTETNRVPKSLTLREAILIALRNNPDVINSELTRITDKYAVELAHYQFEPHYTLDGNATFTSGQLPTYSLDSTVTVQSPIGTTYGADYSTAFDGTGSTVSASISQPLLQGAGYVNQIGYENSLDGEEEAKLAFKGGIITLVSTVITNYLALVQGENNLVAQKRSLDELETTLQQNRLQVKVGRMAPADLLEQESSLESTRVSYEQQLSTQIQNYQSFLLTLGLLPTAKIKVVPNIEVFNYKVPKLKDAIRIAFENNIGYQTALIAMRSQKRSIILAQDALKPTLDVTATETLSGLGTSSPAEGESVTVNGSVPIDNFTERVELINTRIAVQQQELLLEQTKETLISDVTNQLTGIDSFRTQMRLAEQAVKLQNETLQNAIKRQKFGKATMFEVVQQRDTWLSDQLSFIGTEIDYDNGIVDLQMLLGITLDQWNVKLRF